jgi:Fe2+ transport system protein FeoA
VTCSFCGMILDAAAVRATCGGCSISGGGGSGGCRSVCCPRCGYSMPEEPALLGKLRGWIGRREVVRAGVVTLAEMAPGERGTVIKIDGHDPGRARKLMALGVVPGAGVELERKTPAIVFRTGYTQLAVDDALAASIVVDRA